MDIRITIAIILLGGFGLFLLWKGISGDVIKLSSGKAFLPRWFYILSGVAVLILPVSYLILQTMILISSD